jgi:mannose/cellobiose epimerase-like protein (N-acyl-D-glucosamine 2-epimerase family)|tara:strand:+ start:683 stop:952 length:270 start_codon:yes stop_codon:yes gene_type:complete
MAIGRSQMRKQVSKPPQKKNGLPRGLTYFKKGGAASKKSKGSKICPSGKAWAKRTFDTYPSAYANMAASKYCKDPNYAKGAKGKKKKKK